MNTGLFLGTFDPVHTGHLMIADYMINYTFLDEVWFVVSPQNPLKKNNISNIENRINMLHLAFDGNPTYKVCEIELELPKPSYTIHTLDALKKKYPTKEFSIIMGADNVCSLHQWKDYHTILRDYKILVYPRNTYAEKDYPFSPNIIITKAPMVEISSSFIRQSFKEGKTLNYFLPQKVKEYIIGHRIY